jgi:hypothetical protein
MFFASPVLGDQLEFSLSTPLAHLFSSVGALRQHFIPTSLTPDIPNLSELSPQNESDVVASFKHCTLNTPCIMHHAYIHHVILIIGVSSNAAYDAHAWVIMPNRTAACLPSYTPPHSSAEHAECVGYHAQSNGCMPAFLHASTLVRQTFRVRVSSCPIERLRA